MRGGLGMFLKDDTNFKFTDSLSLFTEDEFESVHVCNETQQNVCDREGLQTSRHY